MKGRLSVGILFIVLGVGFFLQQADVISFSRLLLVWWPLIFVVAGFMELFDRKRESILIPVLLIVVGALLIINKQFELQMSAFIWPVFLVIVGIIVIFSRRIDIPRYAEIGDDLNSVAVFAETDIRSESDDFKGGKLTTVFGGVKVDLRHVEVSEQGAVIEITSVFGGVEFYVPENVRVEFGGTPIFGGFEDKTRRRVKDGTEKVIYVQGTFVFSGVEVRD